MVKKTIGSDQGNASAATTAGGESGIESRSNFRDGDVDGKQNGENDGGCTTGKKDCDVNAVSGQEESSSSRPPSLLCQYEPLGYDHLVREMERFDRAYSEMEAVWEEECAKYEETMTSTATATATAATVPRRNYPNPSGSIQDESLFPYHSSMYPLLDAYDCLYYDEGEEGAADGGRGGNEDGEGGGRDALARQPVEPDSIEPSEAPARGRREADPEDPVEAVHGHMPCSVQAMIESLLVDGVRYEDGPGLRESFFPLIKSVLQADSSFLESVGLRGPSSALRQMTNDPGDAVQMPEGVSVVTGEGEETRGSVRSRSKFWTELPLNKDERSWILLRILRHSMSELQRDHLLAAIASLRLLRHRDLDDADALRKFLAIFCSEHVLCEQPCDPDRQHPDHYCSDWTLCMAMLVRTLAFGLTRVTEEHSTAMVAAVSWMYSREFGHLQTDSGDVHIKRKALLKRNLVARRDTEEDAAWDTDRSVAVHVVCSIIAALGVRGAMERRRVLAALAKYNAKHRCLGDDAGENDDYDDDDEEDEEMIANALDSFHNCLRALVGIGEISINMLPDSERFYVIASLLVCYLCHALLDLEVDFCFLDSLDAWRLGVPSSHETSYLGLNHGYIYPERLAAPFRFHDCIAHASERHRRVAPMSRNANLSQNSSSRDRLMQKVRESCLCRPHDDVKDVVRGLFIRDLVDVRTAGCGYADFLLWCRYEVTPLDPAVFWYYCNYPVEESEDEDEEDGENDQEGQGDRDRDDQSIDWDADEEDHKLTKGQLRARFDFSLLLLVRAWNAPWSPESHLSFQPAFREAVRAVALCTHRRDMPNELVYRIASFMHRDWWPDRRRQCSTYACQLDQVARAFKRKHSVRMGGKGPTVSAPILTGSACSNRSSSAFGAAAATATTTTITCTRCNLKRYCSPECRERDVKDGHKKFCGRPPYRAIGQEEEALIDSFLNSSGGGGNAAGGSGDRREQDAKPSALSELEVLGSHGASDEAAWEEVDEDLDEDADDGSWESIDSDEEFGVADEHVTPTQLIYQFFERNTYRKTRE